MGTLLVGLVSATATLIGSYFIFKQTDKKNQLKYITEERQKWRETIRELSASFIVGEKYDEQNSFKPLNNNELRFIREQVALRFNPADKEDKKILKLMDDYIKEKRNMEKRSMEKRSVELEKIKKDLSISFSLLLKHDWERAKVESKMDNKSSKPLIVLFSFIFCFFALFFISPLFFLHFYYSHEMNLETTIFFFTLIKVLIIIIILTFCFYKLIHYFIWSEKYNYENDKSSFLSSYPKYAAYLGYVRRKKLSEIQKCSCCSSKKETNS